MRWRYLPSKRRALREYIAHEIWADGDCRREIIEEGIGVAICLYGQERARKIQRRLMKRTR
jgi:RNase P/RNase MRP subunit POP5